MKKIMISAILMMALTGCKMNDNPFLTPYTTPHATAPFDKIKLEHYEPAVMQAIDEHNKEIDAIVGNTEAPTFENTIVALENSGKLLGRVYSAMGTLLNAETNDDLEALAQKLSPTVSDHYSNIMLNEKLFSRVKAVYDNPDKDKLDMENRKLLDDTYKGFVRQGANLSEEAKKRFREINSELSMISLQFGQNALKENNAFKMNLKENDMEGLPESVKENYKNEDGSYTVTLDYPSYSPFMMYSNRCDLREKLYLAMNTKCTKDNEYNNFENVRKLVNLNMEQAQLLGFKDYAEYSISERMAETPANVYKLLYQLIDAYKPAADKEVKEVEALAKQLEGNDFELKAWDWAYYSEKLKQQTLSLDEEELRPYFELSKVEKGVFGLANKLYGITFVQNADIPVYHPDVKAYDVLDKDGTFLAVLYTDFFPRTGKRSGAWMNEQKSQWIETDGTDSRPHITLTANLSKPTKEKPALLSFDDVETFLHEFGHCLHGIFANGRYASLSGTNVYRDFVELPSQIMENFLTEKEFLSTFAYHYKTGELMPDSLIQKVINASNYPAAYACMRQVSFGLLDMAYYTLTTPFSGDVIAFEKEAMTPTRVLPDVPGTCMSVTFHHIMGGGYEAGYYSYKWAEVLDADAFQRFKNEGIFSTEVAKSFRNNILSRGGVEHPMTLYKRYRGQEPSIDALLQRDGIKKD